MTDHKAEWVERMLGACVPGGSYWDPQRVADAIREYYAALTAAPAASEATISSDGIDSRLIGAASEGEDGAKSMAFDSAEALADWLETLHEADGPAVMCGKWEPAQVAARAIREYLTRPAAQVAAPAVGDGPSIGPALCYGDDWFKQITIGGHTFLAPLDTYEAALNMLSVAIWPKRRAQVAATPKHDERSEAFKMLVAVARAAHRAMDSGEEFADRRVMLEASGATELTHALDAMDALPDVPDPNYVYDGWARAEYFAAQPTPKHDEGRDAAWEKFISDPRNEGATSAETEQRFCFNAGYSAALATQPAARRVTDEDVERACGAAAIAAGEDGWPGDRAKSEIADCRTYMRAALESFAGMNWQPIDTAPKDGTRVAVKFKNGFEDEATYRTTYGGEWHVKSFTHLPWSNQPTHWRPLHEEPQP